jgi:hypothetical protein
MRFRLGRFLLRADGADDGGAQSLRPLANDQPDTAGRGVNEDGVAGLHLVSPPQQVVRGHAFQHDRRRGAIVDRARQLHHFRRIDQPRLGISAERAGAVGDAVCDLESLNAGTDLFDYARRLESDGGWQIGDGIEPGALIDVDEVEPYRRLPQTNLSRPRLADLDLFETQDLGSAGFMHTHCVNHQIASFIDKNNLDEHGITVYACTSVFIAFNHGLHDALRDSAKGLRSPQIFGEEGFGSLIGEPSRLRIPVRAALAGEGVIAAGIDMHLDARILR